MESKSQPDSSKNTSDLSYRVMIMYGVGEIANAIKVTTFALYSLFFATTVMGLPGTWVGALGFITLLWDAVIDPYIGYLTDEAHVHSRRYNLMLVGALTMGVSFWAFFSPPHNVSTVTLLIWLLGTGLLVRTATSMYSISYYALGATLSRDYHERTSITGIRGITSTMGTLMVASLSFVLFFPEKTPGVDPKLEYSGYASMGLTFGLVMTIVALIPALSTRPLRCRLMNNAVQRQQTPGDFLGSMWESLSNPSFCVLLASFSLTVVGLAINSSLFLYYLPYYVKVRESMALASSQLAFFIGGLLGTMFWLRISKKFDKHWLYVFAAVVISALMLAALTLFGEGRLFGTGDIRPLLIGYSIAGFFSCILGFIPPSMLADVADESELITGKRREGAYFGIFSFGQRVAAGVAVLLAGGLLDWFAGLAPGQAQQSDLTVYRIAVVYSVIPAGLFIMAAILMLNYKLTRSRVISIRVELDERRKPQEIIAETQ